MSLDDFTPDIDSQEWGWQSAEAPKEVSEKFKESVKRSGAKIKKAQKVFSYSIFYLFLLFVLFLVDQIIK